MKRFALFTVLALGIVALVTAQGSGPWGMMGPGFGPRMPGTGNWNRGNTRLQFTREDVTVSGDLTIVQGSLAVKSGDITYVTTGLSRFIGFIDTLKEGARVSLEGTAITNPRDEKTKYLMVTKLTIAGKSYDIGRPLPVFPNRQTPPQEPRAPRERRSQTDS